MAGEAPWREWPITDHDGLRSDSEDSIMFLPSRLRSRKDPPNPKSSSHKSRQGSITLRGATPTGTSDSVQSQSGACAPPVGDTLRIGSGSRSGSETEFPTHKTKSPECGLHPVARPAFVSTSRNGQQLSKSYGNGRVSERISSFSRNNESAMAVKKDNSFSKKNGSSSKSDSGSFSKSDNDSFSKKDATQFLRKDGSGSFLQKDDDNEHHHATRGNLTEVKGNSKQVDDLQNASVEGGGGGKGDGAVDRMIYPLDMVMSRRLTGPRITPPGLHLKKRREKPGQMGLWGLIVELRDNRLEAFILLLIGLAYAGIAKAFAIVGQILRFVSLPQWLENIWQRAAPRGPFMMLTNGINPDYSLSDGTIRWFPDASTENPINAKVMAMASKLAYEELELVRHVVSEKWKMQWVRGCFFHRQGMQVITLRCRDAVVVVFRAAAQANPWEWMLGSHVSMYQFDPVWDAPSPQADRSALGRMNRDVVTRLMDLPSDGNMPFLSSSDSYGMKELGQDATSVWRGYERTPYDLIKKEVLEMLRSDTRSRLFVGGHGIGAGCAAVFTALLLADDASHRLIKRIGGLYTFGQPRVGCGKFANFLERLNTRKDGMLRYLRFVNNNDVFPRMPPASKGMYQHGGSLVHLTRAGEIMVLTEQPRMGIFKVVKDNMWTFFERLFEVPWYMGRESMSSTVFRFIWCYVPAAFTDHFMSEYQLSVSRICEPICL